VGTYRTVFNPNLVKESYVISRYIDNPLLMGGKKFDLRYIAGLFPWTNIHRSLARPAV
jgi:hypothetical protein